MTSPGFSPAQARHGRWRGDTGCRGHLPTTGAGGGASGGLRWLGRAGAPVFGQRRRPVPRSWSPPARLARLWPWPGDDHVPLRRGRTRTCWPGRQAAGMRAGRRCPGRYPGCARGGPGPVAWEVRLGPARPGGPGPRRANRLWGHPGRQWEASTADRESSVAANSDEWRRQSEFALVRDAGTYGTCQACGHASTRGACTPCPGSPCAWTANTTRNTTP